MDEYVEAEPEEASRKPNETEGDEDSEESGASCAVTGCESLGITEISLSVASQIGLRTVPVATGTTDGSDGCLPVPSKVWVDAVEPVRQDLLRPSYGYLI